MKSSNKAKMKMVLPAVGVSMAAGAALLMMAKPKKKHQMQKAAGRAIRAGVEHPAAELLLSGALARGGAALVEVRYGALSLQALPPAPPSPSQRRKNGRSYNTNK